ncbi:flagellar motor switch protein FliG [Duganella sp. BJB488]|uniref:flagellar motor switch protein FliG n=1 Tax=unclassified Duganella TaxID=2636909 RepID=UPI000E34E07F|nr:MULTISPECIES: flagellar motor switch protein FliG [unclassified Duganella]RFP10240.1 flagellar motor switch protein FliG [Duganella sp. BJB489]RFP18161.1 flagellar motor switch protein FliG [Duganella sp. BJB488]RFP37922.1 flagellar motor switch protein FliG [Duganella sp. BJB480]
MAELNNMQNDEDYGNAVHNAQLSPVEQAAIVLLSIGEEPAAAVLRCLTREELLEVTQVMSRMSGIKVESVKTAMQTFFDDYRQQSGVHGASRSYLKRSLDLALGGDLANTVLNNIYGDELRPKMARLQWASPKWLAEYISNEHVQMQAVFLAFLPPALAGQIIDALPADGRDLVLLNLARMEEVDRDLLLELDELVMRCLSSFDSQSTSVEGIRQAAEILNRLPSNRAQMVELLRAHDPDVVSKIELSMYDFFILGNQSEVAITRIIEEVPLEQWAIALKGAEVSIRDAILKTMPKRQAQAFEDMMRRAGPMPLSRIEQTRQEIMATVKALADVGEIEIQLFAEQVIE